MACSVFCTIVAGLAKAKGIAKPSVFENIDYNLQDSIRFIARWKLSLNHVACIIYSNGAQVPNQQVL